MIATLNNHLISQFFFPLFRLSGMFIAAPVLGSHLVPVRIRVILALLVTLLILPLIPEIPVVDALSIHGFLLMANQVLIGVAIGLIFQLVFQVIVLGGQLLAMQSGLGFATMVDPQNHDNLPVITQFYLFALTLLFLSTDGHLSLLQMIVSSFQTFPIGWHFLSVDNFIEIAAFAGDIFSGAVSIALPAIISLLMVNLTFAIVTKSAPQINIFSIGFPLTLILGLTVMYLSFPSMIHHAEMIFSHGFSIVNDILGVS